MGNPVLTRRMAQDAFDTVESSGGNISEAARKLGLSRRSVRNRMERGAELYGLGTATPAEAGQVIKGRSTLYNQDGDKVLEWVKTQSEPRHEDIKQALHDAFGEYKGKAKLGKAPQHTSEDLLTVYPIVDHHLGLYAWAEETGANWDLETGERVLRDTMRSLVEGAPKSRTAIILNLGDFFHADTSENKTIKSGNPLDVDSRYAKVIKAGVNVLIDCVHLAAQKHEKVIVRCLPGNHDEHSALMLTVCMAMYFHDCKNVDVDENPSRFFSHEFGTVLLAATHGDMVRLNEMAGVMAAYWPQAWGRTKYRYGLTGHVHHNSKTRIEHSGVECESFQSLVAKDAWHSAKGYSSGRSMVAITYHKDKGEWLRSRAAL